MECVQGALNTCFRKEIPQICFDQNGCCFNPQNVVSSDDFFVDQLLDLSNQDQFLEDDDEEILDDEEDDDKGSASISVSGHELLHHNSLISDVPSLPSGELTVPADDLASLEWLSHFVEDSFSGFSAPFPATEVKTEAHGSVSPPQPSFKTPVPVKARSKRRRNGGRVWCLRSPSLTESSSSSTTSSSSSSPASPWLFPQNSDKFEPEIPASKKPRRRLLADKARACGAHPQAPRRCSHCGVQKTPQWRTGPLGAKTLCNACGVRFKSGRLLPEYRPACSPTFSSELHSNHHRKVLEMRRNKETTGASDAVPALPSF